MFAAVRSAGGRWAAAMSHNVSPTATVYPAPGSPVEPGAALSAGPGPPWTVRPPARAAVAPLTGGDRPRLDRLRHRMAEPCRHDAGRTQVAPLDQDGGSTGHRGRGRNQVRTPAPCPCGVPGVAARVAWARSVPPTSRSSRRRTTTGGDQERDPAGNPADGSRQRAERPQRQPHQDVAGPTSRPATPEVRAAAPPDRPRGRPGRATLPAA
jgi:hypothetical protein